MPFTRMDQGKIEEWMAIGQAVGRRQAAMPRVIRAMLLQLEEQVDGFAVDQFQHALQTATRAQRAGASEERVPVATEPKPTLSPIFRTTLYFMDVGDPFFSGS